MELNAIGTIVNGIIQEQLKLGHKDRQVTIHSEPQVLKKLRVKKIASLELNVISKIVNGIIHFATNHRLNLIYSELSRILKLAREKTIQQNQPMEIIIMDFNLKTKRLKSLIQFL